MVDTAVLAFFTAIISIMLALVFAFLWLQSRTAQRWQQQERERHLADRAAFLVRVDTEARQRIRRLQTLLSETGNLSLSPQQKRHLLNIRKQTDENNRFFSDIVEFAELNAKAFHDSEETFDLEGLATDVVRTFASVLRYEDVEIVIQVRDSANLLFQGQKRHVATLIVHLVEHAIANIHKGELTLSFVGRETGEGTREITLAVTDNGPGLSKEALPGIFDPFTQYDPLSSRREIGSGLGLAIARQCARSLGGELSVVSTEHQGTTFTARVPLTLASGSQPGPVVPSDALRQQCSRVLIVEDSHGNARYLRDLFDSWKIPSNVYTSARECLQFLRAQEVSPDEIVFDLMLLDDSIEDFDYVSLMHYLQSRRGLVRKVVLMAPLTDVSASSARMREPGIDGHILKPIRRRELLRVLEFAGSIPVQEPEHKQPPRAVPPPDSWDAHNPKVRCLVVEDNLVNMHTVTELLRLKNYDFLVAENGREAVAVYTQNASQIDVILMDVQMPEMDGFEATRRIRTEEEGKGRRVPILALTAFSLEEEREKCLEAGMDDFLPKPIHVDALYEKIDLWVAQSHDAEPQENGESSRHC